MPALSNIRHERFARYWIRTGIAAQAYLKSGYETTTYNATAAAASRLLKHVNVNHRIRELKKQMATRNRITVDSLVEELDEARAAAKRLNQPSVEVSATMSKARLAGLLIDRKEMGEPGAFAGAQSEESMIARVNAELGPAAAAALQTALAQVEEQPAELAEPEPAPAASPIPVPTHGTGGALN